jgi:two-component system KDP operon response regulator KdpE
MNEGHILVVDDEPQIRRVMRTTLVAAGFEVNDVRTGAEAIEQTRSEKYDLVILDINMPGMTGLETCRHIRTASDVPIIMLTVRSREKDKVDALDAGADDYITKPFSTPELLARIRAALRRRTILSASPLKRVQLGDIEIDFESREVKARRRPVHLTYKEFELLSCLAAHPNQTISHRDLLKAVWGPDYGNELEYLRVFVNRLRKKLEPNPSNPRFLLTDTSAGYRFHIPHKDL